MSYLASSEFGTVQIADNILTFSPNQNFNGNAQVELTVSDNQLTASGTLLITVLPVNDPPVLTEIPNQTINEDEIFTYGLDTIDIDGDQVSYSIVIISGSASYQILNDELTIIPDLNFNGEIFLSVAVDDGELADSDTFTINVESVNDEPFFVTQVIDNAIEDLFYQFELTVGDVDSEISNLVITEGPEWIQVNGLELLGTPTVDDIGDYQINLTISDGENVTSQIFELTIESVNDIPISENATTTTNEDEILEIILIGNDEETPDDLQFNIVDEPLHGILTASRALGVFTYTPDSNYNGSDSFTYNVCDSENSSEISTVSITINPVNDAPYFITSYTDLPSAIENENFICPIEIFDIDNESASLSVTPLICLIGYLLKT